MPLVCLSVCLLATLRKTYCMDLRENFATNVSVDKETLINFGSRPLLHRESKKGATLTMAVTLSILDRFAKFFHCCKQH